MEWTRLGLHKIREPVGDARKKVCCSVKTTENKKEKKEIIDSETKRQ